MSTPASIFPRGPRPAGYDLGCEVLCSLPPAAPVALKVLAGDLGITVRELRNTIGFLSVSGFGIHLGDEQCWADPSARHRIAQAAGNYWQAVWAKRLAS